METIKGYTEKELQQMVINARKRNIFIRGKVWCKIWCIIGPTYIKHPVRTVKKLIELEINDLLQSRKPEK